MLSATKVEFQNFGVLMSAVEKQVGTVQNTIKKVNSKTKTINRQLKDVEVLEVGTPSVTLLEGVGSETSAGQEPPVSAQVERLAASGDEEFWEDEDENY